MSMKSKILIPAIGMVIVMVAAILISVNLVFSNYVEKSVIEEIDTYSKVVESKLQGLSDSATLNSELLSMDDGIIQGVIDGDRDVLHKRASELMESSTVDFCTILNEYGEVMLRVHEPDNYGDSLANQMNISSALKGEPLTTVESGTAVRFSVRCGQPIVNENGIVVGVVSSGYRLDQNHFVDEMKELTGAEVTVFLGDERISTTILSVDGERAIGTKADETVSNQVLNGTEYTGRAQILGNDAYVKYIPLREADNNIVGMLFVGRFTSSINETKSSFVYAGILVAAIVLVIMATALYMLIRRMTKSIKDMADIAKEIAEGSLDIKVAAKGKDETSTLAHAFNDMIKTIKTLVSDMKFLAMAASNGELSTRVDSSKHKGEYRAIVEGINETLDAVVAPIQNAASVLGEMKNGNLQVKMDGNYNGEHAIIQEALNDTIHRLRFYIDEIKEVLSAMANGDLSINITSDFQGDFVELKDAINFISNSLSIVMRNINDAAAQVAAGSQQVSDGSQEVSQGATEQAGSIEKLTVTVANIAEQTKEMALNVNEVAKIAKANKNDAEIGKKHMQDMQEAMQEINSSSLSISKIIKVIDDIAFQTNILALNAAVEASRAGAHGKGFAVVAEEVRSLATKSANAAKETTAMIESSINKANIGTKYADEATASFSAIADVIERAVTALDDIGKSANEQATGIEQVNTGIEQLSTVVHINSATSQEAAATTEQLSSQADILKQLVRQFKLKDIAAKEDKGKPYIALPPLRVLE